MLAAFVGGEGKHVMCHVMCHQSAPQVVDIYYRKQVKEQVGLQAGV